MAHKYTSDSNLEGELSALFTGTFFQMKPKRIALKDFYSRAASSPPRIGRPMDPSVRGAFYRSLQTGPSNVQSRIT